MRCTIATATAPSMSAKRQAAHGVEEAPAPFMYGHPAARFALDTNVLIYAVDARAPVKQRLAKELLRRAALSDCLLTLQSVREFFVVASRKNLSGRGEAAMRAKDLMENFRVCVETTTATRVALDAASAGKGSMWDSLLVATAVEAGCSYVVSEDMGPGMHPLGARIVRPFHGDRLSAEVEALLVQ